jgi:hypothetical protein
MSKDREICDAAAKLAVKDGYDPPRWLDQEDGEHWLTISETGAKDGFGHILLIANHGALHGIDPPDPVMEFLSHFLSRQAKLLDVVDAARAMLDDHDRIDLWQAACDALAALDEHGGDS